jgi:hypothetical protein
MQDHTLRWIDAQPLEQFGVAQRQFHHLPYLIDGIAQPADIAVCDVGAAGLLRLHILRQKLDFGLRLDPDDALWRSADDIQAAFLQGESLAVVELPKELIRRPVRSATLVHRGEDHVARHHRPPDKSVP